MAIKSIKDLIVWQDAVLLTKKIYLITNTFPPEEKYNISKHSRESSRGVAANIAEGFGRYHFKEKLQFYGIARGCLNELISDIEISYQVNYINLENFQDLNNLTDKIGKMLNVLIVHTADKLTYYP